MWNRRKVFEGSRSHVGHLLQLHNNGIHNNTFNTVHYARNVSSVYQNNVFVKLSWRAHKRKKCPHSIIPSNLMIDRRTIICRNLYDYLVIAIVSTIYSMLIWPIWWKQRKVCLNILGKSVLMNHFWSIN